MGQRILSGAILAAAIFTLGGCYYYEVAQGQAEVLWSKESVSQVIKEGKYKKYADLLREVPRIKNFGIEKILLKNTKNYSQYYHTEKPGMTHVLTAAYPLAFKSYQWEYVFVGKMPFKGFFNEKSFQKELAHLKTLDLDVWSFYSTAYSTLGWFKDPITTPMLKRGLINLVNSILHEQVHETLYVKNEGDFNEQLASFVANKAAEQYIKTYHPKLSATVNRSDPRTGKLKNLLWQARNQLQTLYDSPKDRAEKILQKKRIIEQTSAKIAAIYPNSSLRFRTINNARLLQLSRYRHDTMALEELWQDARQDWPMFWERLRNNQAAIIARTKATNTAQ